MIHYLIWDAGGTLFDTYPAIVRAFQKALWDYEVAASASWIKQLARQSRAHCAEKLAQAFDFDLTVLYQKYEAYYERTPPMAQPAFPGVKKVCTYICDLGGQNFIVTHRGYKSLRGLLQACQLEAYFSDIVAREDGCPRKPNPTSLTMLIEKHAIAREQTLAIGDRDIDILAGQAARVRTCLFSTGETYQVQPTYEVHDYAELYRLIVTENQNTA